MPRVGKPRHAGRFLQPVDEIGLAARTFLRVRGATRESVPLRHVTEERSLLRQQPRGKTAPRVVHLRAGQPAIATKRDERAGVRALDAELVEAIERHPRKLW